MERIAVIVGHEWQDWLIGAVRVFVHPEVRTLIRAKRAKPCNASLDRVDYNFHQSEAADLDRRLPERVLRRVSSIIPKPDRCGIDRSLHPLFATHHLCMPQKRDQSNSTDNISKQCGHEKVDGVRAPGLAAGDHQIKHLR